MLKEVKAERLTTATIIKLHVIGAALSWPFIAVGLGIYGLFGSGHLARFNGQFVSGTEGLIQALVMALQMVLVFGLINGLFCVFGLWLYSKFRPISVKLRVVQSSESET